MKTHGAALFVFVAFLAIVLAACAPAVPVTGSTSVAPSPVVVRETVVVVVTATAPAAATPAAGPTATAAATAVAASATATVKPVAVKPTPTPLVLVNVPIEGGDPNNKFFASLVFPNYQPAATKSLVFQVLAHKPLNSKVDGEGIATVDFLITDSNDKKVHFREEQTAHYCAFGGGEPDCIVWDFAGNGYKWPDGAKIVSGAYTITVTITAKDNAVMFGSTYFRIQVP